MNLLYKNFLALRNRLSSSVLLKKYGYLETLYPESIRFHRSSFTISFVSNLEITLCQENEFLLKGFEKLKLLNDSKFFSEIDYLEDSSLQIVINNINLHIKTYDEIYIVNEIFREGCYNFLLNTDSIVIDIGMNVGIASLYFASKNYVKKIYSFEPMGPTYVVGLKNLSRNIELATRIESFNFGLASTDRCETWGFNPIMKGQAGFFFDESNTLQKEEVVLRKADEVLWPIVEKHKGNQIIIKIDCEGGEYEIIPLLEKAGILNHVHLISMEWHGNKVHELINCLEKKFLIVKNNHSEELGIIYAFNKFISRN